MDNTALPSIIGERSGSVLFVKDDWSIWLIKGQFTLPDNSLARTLKITGTGLNLEPKTPYELFGDWEKRDNEWQYKVKSILPVLSMDPAGMIKMLSSPLIKACGKQTARKIVERFGPNTYTILEHSPDDLLVLPLMSKRRVDLISRSFAELTKGRMVLVHFLAAGVPLKRGREIAEHYGREATQIIKTAPHRIVLDGYLNFAMAEKLARYYQAESSHPARIAAAIVEATRLIEQNGDTWCPKGTFIQKATELLRTNDPQRNYNIAVEHMLNRMAESKRNIRCVEINDEQRIFNAETYQKECSIAFHLTRLKGAVISKANGEAKENGLGLVPSPEQTLAIETAAQAPVSIITGVAGGGKTTVIRLLLDVLGGMVCLLAPTGKAAQRMMEQTGHPASTIHSLLRIFPDTGESYVSEIEADTVIIDEASMIDNHIMEAVLSRIKTGSRLVLIGDPYQLPSIGAGNVLFDLIQSKTLPVTHLQVLFRQKSESGVALNAQRIRSQETGFLAREDFVLIEEGDELRARDIAIELYKEELKKLLANGKTGDDILLLVPQRFERKNAQGQVMNPCCSNALNHLLKNTLNPVNETDQIVKYWDKVYSTGDRVMQLKNTTYESVLEGAEDVYISNGDTGQIVSIKRDREASALIIEISFSGQNVYVEYQDFEFIQHAYACTVHKSQGSE